MFVKLVCGTDGSKGKMQALESSQHLTAMGTN